MLRFHGKSELWEISDEYSFWTLVLVSYRFGRQFSSLQAINACGLNSLFRSRLSFQRLLVELTDLKVFLAVIFKPLRRKARLIYLTAHAGEQFFVTHFWVELPFRFSTLQWLNFT